MIGMANKNENFEILVGLTQRFEVAFLMILMDSLCLRVTQMPRSRDLAIFVLIDRQTDGQNRLLYPLLRIRKSKCLQLSQRVHVQA